MRRRFSAALLALAALATVGVATLTRADHTYDTAIAAARSADDAAAKQSIADLRRAGPAALRALLAEYDRTADASLIPTIDAVAAQRDARWSRLYWYTDLAAAKSAATAEHKPILALRMLGNLTDEYSCANSRFFRTALYANQNVSNILRDKYILVWSSERPVPVVTIDYGDGRVLKRTITGNSIHYILNARGEVIDALPGLYDPQTFASLLTEAVSPASSDNSELIRSYHQSALAALDSEWAANIAHAVPVYGLSPASVAQLASARAFAKDELESPLVSAASPTPAPHAAAAALLAQSKLGVEGPLVRAVVPANPPHAAIAMRLTASKGRVESSMISNLVPPAAMIPADANPELWSTLAARHPATLDRHSIDMIRFQNPAAYINPAKLDQVVNNFQQAIAIDTLRNNQLFRRHILGWLQESAIPMGLLNKRVYSDLFLTPRSDPWLGMVPDSTYSALTGDGCAIN